MSVTVIIPAPLRKYVNNTKALECQASSVTEVFDHIKSESQALFDHLITSEGSVREFIRVYVNKNDIKHRDGLATPVASGDVVSIMPAFAGG